MTLLDILIAATKRTYTQMYVFLIKKNIGKIIYNFLYIFLLRLV